MLGSWRRRCWACSGCACTRSQVSNAGVTCNAALHVPSVSARAASRLAHPGVRRRRGWARRGRRGGSSGSAGNWYAEPESPMGPGVTLPGSRAPFSLRSSFTRSAYLPTQRGQHAAQPQPSCVGPGSRCAVGARPITCAASMQEIVSGNAVPVRNRSECVTTKPTHAPIRSLAILLGLQHVINRHRASKLASCASLQQPCRALRFGSLIAAHVCAPQRVERVLAAGGRWRNIGDHHRARLLAHKRVAQHLQSAQAQPSVAGAEMSRAVCPGSAHHAWQVQWFATCNNKTCSSRALATGMHGDKKRPHTQRAARLSELGAAEGHVARDAVQRADALLQRQQALVDLRALQPRLPALAPRTDLGGVREQSLGLSGLFVHEGLWTGTVG